MNSENIAIEKARKAEKVIAIISIGTILLVFAYLLLFPLAKALVSGCPGSGPITSVAQKLVVNDDSSVLLSERISVDSTFGLKGLAFELPSERERVAVHHSGGSDYYYSDNRENLLITGDGKTRLNPGHNEFNISYLAHNQVTSEEDRAELVWNLTSDLSNTAIEKVSFLLELPHSVRADDVEVKVYRKNTSRCKEQFTAVEDLRRSNNGHRLLLTADSLRPLEKLKAHISWPESSTEKRLALNKNYK